MMSIEDIQIFLVQMSSGHLDIFGPGAQLENMC